MKKTRSLVALLDFANVHGNENKAHNLIGGVIRRNTLSTRTGVVDADKWFFLNDGSHIPLNIDMSRGDLPDTTQGGIGLHTSGQKLEIFYYGDRLNTLNITPDETFLAKGLMIGNSTGSSNAVLTLSAPLDFNITTAGVVTCDESMWDPLDTRFAIDIDDTDPTNYGLVTITHPACNDLPIINYKNETTTSANFKPIYVSDSGTQLQFFMVGQHEGWITYNGVNWVAASTECYDISEVGFSWDGVNGVLTVTHPRLHQTTGSGVQLTPILEIISSPSYSYELFEPTNQGFKVAVRNASGAPVLTESTDMNFMFNTGFTARVHKDKMLGSFDIGIQRSQPYAKDIDMELGNFWITGITETDD